MHGHKPDKCTLKKPCNICKELHLTILHNIALQRLTTGPHVSDRSAAGNTLNLLVRAPCPADTLYIDQPNRSPRVMFKVVPVFLINGQQRRTYAILDDGSERTIILTSAVSQLQLKGPEEILNFRTVRHKVIPITGETISCSISPLNQKKRINFLIANAFSAPVLNLAENSCPASDLQREYPHLRGLPLPDVVHARPLILIGSDHCLQGPANALPQPLTSGVQTLFTLCNTVSCPATAELMENVERLWRLDSFPHRKEKEVSRSKQDHYCLELLETKTAAIEAGGCLGMLPHCSEHPTVHS